MALSERFKDQGVVGVALREPAEAVRAFAKEFWIRFPLWMDPDGRSPAAFGVYGHPATILIDRAGRLVGRARGERNWATDDARRLVELLLGGEAQGSRGRPPPVRGTRRGGKSRDSI